MIGYDNDKSESLPEPVDDHPEENSSIENNLPDNDEQTLPIAAESSNNHYIPADISRETDHNSTRGILTTEEQYQILKICTGIKIAHLNCSSLTKNIDEIRILLERTHIDVLTLSETHLSNFIEDSEISCDGYFIVRRDRDRAGGGVATYIREDLNFIVRDELSVNDLETIAIEVKRPFSRSMIIINWYRPPSSNVAVIHAFEQMLEKLDFSSSECIILGDMNCDVVKVDMASHTKHLCEIMDRFNFKQLITSPTRVTNSTSSLIDLIWTNEQEKIGKASVIETALSDHYLVYCTVGKRPMSKENEHRYKVGRNMSKVNTAKLKGDAAVVTWEEVESKDDVVGAYDLFEKKLLCLLDKHAPVRKSRIKKKESPWINNEILMLIRQRNEQKKKAKKSSALDDWKSYKHLRNKVTACIRLAKKDYVTNSINECNGQTGDIWKSLKCLMPQKQKSVKISHIEKDGHEIDDKSEIANSFNNHFINIGRKIQRSVAPPVDDYQNENQGKLHFPKCASNFRFNAVNEQQVLNVINDLKEKKACGPDSIPVILWKIIAEYILKPFTYIINLSFKQGISPSEWKKSRVIPVFKSGNKSDMNNYRPISILSVAAKIVEKLAFDQLYTYVDQKGILSRFQCGFRPKHSTNTALFNVTEDWLEFLDKGYFVGVVTLDLQKAFDTVDHSILLCKLRLIGADDLSMKWFSSYLTNRMQYTCVNGAESSSQRMHCGISQGSNLGPLLFIIYINDLSSCLRNCKTSLYADDTCLYYASPNPHTLTESLNTDLLSIEAWLKRNRLALNVKKCEFLLIGTKKRLKSAVVEDVIIQNVPINRVTHLKYLGVVIDQHLDWAKHIECIGKKISKDIHLMKRIRPYITQQTALIFYKSVIQSRFDYCSAIWGNAGKGSLDKLQKITEQGT